MEEFLEKFKSLLQAAVQSQKDQLKALADLLIEKYPTRAQLTNEEEKLKELMAATILTTSEFAVYSSSCSFITKKNFVARVNYRWTNLLKKAYTLVNHLIFIYWN